MPEWNSETDLMWINASNISEIYNEFNRIMEENKDMDDYDLGAEFEKFIDDTYNQEEKGMPNVIQLPDGDAWDNRNFADIDWQAIAHHWKLP